MVHSTYYTVSLPTTELLRAVGISLIWRNATYSPIIGPGPLVGGRVAVAVATLKEGLKLGSAFHSNALV